MSLGEGVGALAIGVEHGYKLRAANSGKQSAWLTLKNKRVVLVATLTPGSYTAVLAGKNGGTGIGLVEVYDLAQGANSKLANISSWRCAAVRTPHPR